MKDDNQAECEFRLDACALWYDRSQVPSTPSLVNPQPEVDTLRRDFLALARRGQEGLPFTNGNSSFDKPASSEQPGFRGRWFPADGAAVDLAGGRNNSGALVFSPSGKKPAEAFVRIPEFDHVEDCFYSGDYGVSFYARKAPEAAGALELVVCRALRDERVERWHVPLPEGTDWTYREFTTSVPASLCDGFLCLSFHGTGRVWVDDFRVISKAEVSRGESPLTLLNLPVVIQVEEPKSAGTP